MTKDRKYYIAQIKEIHKKLNKEDFCKKITNLMSEKEFLDYINYSNPIAEIFSSSLEYLESKTKPSRNLYWNEIEKAIKNFDKEY